MIKSTIRLVNLAEIIISSIFSWVIKEILDYVKFKIKNRVHFKGSLHMKCLTALVLLITMNKLLKLLKWQEQALEMVKPYCLWSVSTLINVDDIPRFTFRLIPKCLEIFKAYLFIIII